MFRFKLQTILDVRKTLEDKILHEFAEQQQALEREREQLQAIRKQKSTLIEALRNVQGKKVNVSEITMNAEYIKQCLKRELLQQEQVEEAKRLTELKKVDLFEAIKKRKSMEILKTQHYNQHRSELNQLERTAIDEMVIVRHNRKKEE